MSGLSACPSCPTNAGDTILTYINKKKIRSDNIMEETTLDGLVGGSQLMVCPNYLNDKDCQALTSEVLACADSGKMRQYGRGMYNEPRLHVLLNSNTEQGMGYSYKDVHMAAHSFDLIPGIEPIANRLAQKLDVPGWKLGVDVIVYGSGHDGIGWHSDNSQGETTVACIILHTTDNPRPLLIKPSLRNAGSASYKLKMSRGTLYSTDKCFQLNYLHKVPKLDTTKGTSSLDRRIVLVFRDGHAVQTSDNGEEATLESRMTLPDTVQFGPIDGIEEGLCYPRRKLLDIYAYRAGIKAVNGRIGRGCDSIVLSRNDPEHGEVDGTLLTPFYFCVVLIANQLTS